MSKMRVEEEIES